MRSQPRFALRKARLPGKRRDDAEYRLQRAVVQFLHLAAVPGAFCIAIPNGLVSDAVTVSRMKSAGLFPGAADLLIVLPSGEAAFLELKTPDGKQSDAQKAFEALCKRWGRKYAIARSLDEALGILCAWGALQPRARGKWPAITAAQEAEAA